MKSSLTYDEPRSAFEQKQSEKGIKLQNGLAKLILTLADVVRQVLEKQALRRVDEGSLTQEEVERLGLAFIELKAKLEEMSAQFGLKPEELATDLASLIRLPEGELANTSLVDVVDRLLDKGAVVAGQVKISVADVDLVGLDLFAMLYPIGGKDRKSQG